MPNHHQEIRKTVVLAMFIAAILIPEQLFAGSAAEIDREVKSALKNLYATTPAAKELSNKAAGILVFPDITKAGLIVGGQYGEGALLKGGETAGYYSSIEGSFGLQAGAQKFGYALFFMTDEALQYLKNSDGFEIGTGPTVVIVDEGLSKSLSSTTLKDDIYAFFFDQKGLMAGLGLKGSKITPFTPDK